MTNYTDSEGHSSAVLEFDLLSRPKITNDGKATRTNTYDPITGDLTSVNDSGAGLFTGSYDLDGRLIAQSLPNGIVKWTEHDNAGSPNYLEYDKTSGCSSNCTLFWNFAVENIHGQTVSLSGELTQSGKETGQEYQYDAAGRLIRTDDWEDDGADWTCTLREYELDEDSNRTKLKSAAPAGNCSTTTTTKSSTYDAADRLIKTGYTYDAFGRITTVPQADAGGGSQLTASYYVNDLARSITQAGTTQTLELDPLQRMATKTKTGATTSTEIYAYDGDSDSPAWTQTGTTWTRFVGGIGGDMEATQLSSGSTKVAINNLRGDTVAEATATSLVGVRRVDEFGVVTGGLPSSRRYGFHGSKQREALTSSGTIAMGVRLYVPRVGRFLQTDPVLGGNATSYSYPEDPINQFDLDGRKGAGGLCSPYHVKKPRVIHMLNKPYVTGRGGFQCMPAASTGDSTRIRVQLTVMMQYREPDTDNWINIYSSTRARSYSLSKGFGKATLTTTTPCKKGEYDYRIAIGISVAAPGAATSPPQTIYSDWVTLRCFR